MKGFIRLPTSLSFIKCLTFSFHKYFISLLGHFINYILMNFIAIPFPISLAFIKYSTNLIWPSYLWNLPKLSRNHRGTIKTSFLALVHLTSCDHLPHFFSPWYPLHCFASHQHLPVSWTVLESSSCNDLVSFSTLSFLSSPFLQPSLNVSFLYYSFCASPLSVLLVFSAC